MKQNEVYDMLIIGAARLVTAAYGAGRTVGAFTGKMITGGEIVSTTAGQLPGFGG